MEFSREFGTPSRLLEEVESWAGVTRGFVRVFVVVVMVRCRASEVCNVRLGNLVDERGAFAE